MASDNVTIHPFERAGLGKAPFRFVGYSYEIYQAVPGDPRCPVQPGTSCDYCGQAISHVCRIKSVDGKLFKVGCDCVEKLNATANHAHGMEDPDVKLMLAAKRAKNAAARLKRQDKAVARKARLDEALNNSTVRLRLANEPHPRGFTDRETGEPLTLLDWAEWMMKNSGDKGRTEIEKRIAPHLH